MKKLTQKEKAKQLLRKYGLPSEEKYSRNDIFNIVAEELKEQKQKHYAILNELIEECFPKGKCEERGEAILVLTMFKQRTK